ncbi:nuclear transport factor 2 family protein [Candidatus Korobacter versatilis]|nr:nuclear transport factor 2 family protein [Candidatus Koribacter versatilis]
MISQSPTASKIPQSTQSADVPIDASTAETLMSSVEDEIRRVEERLRIAQLHCDPKVLDQLLDERMLLLSDGQPYFAKARIMEMYAPHAGPHLKSIHWRDSKIINFGTAAIVICRGEYISDQFNISLEFMRFWLHKGGQWKLIAGTISQPTTD